jgi:hypothetical protein
MQLHGPWLVDVGGRSVLVCLAGTRLVGLEPRTGKPAWDPVNLGCASLNSPAFADLDGDGRIDMVLLGPDSFTVRAVTVPAGKVLWEHKLPKDTGWIPRCPGTGFLCDPLPIDLDGDGMAEVIVPAERGTIAVLDGANGKVRWRSTVAINQGIPSAARVLVGPDLDGDGCRDVFVANEVCDAAALARGGALLDASNEHLSLWESFRPLVRVQALSGKTGQALWRCHLPTTADFPASARRLREPGTGEPLLLWEGGRDGWPMLVVPGNPLSFIVEAGTGQLAHVIPGVAGPYRAIDLGGHGSPALIGFQPSRSEDDGPSGVLPTRRLHLFLGTGRDPLVNPFYSVVTRSVPSFLMASEAPADSDPKAESRQVVTPREEAVDWVPLPWVGIMEPQPVEQVPVGLDLPTQLGFLRYMLRTVLNQLRALLLVPALLFLGYVGFCLFRKGWSSLWFPALGYLVTLIVLIVFFLSHRRTFEPWQRYTWDGWYWILYIALVFAAIVTPLLWLGILAFRWLFRLLARQRARAAPAVTST